MRKEDILSIMMAVAMAANLAGRGSSGTGAESGEPTETVEASSEEEETPSGAEEAVPTEAKSGKIVSNITIAYVLTTMNNPSWTAVMGGTKDIMTDKGMDPGRQLATVDIEGNQVTVNNYIYDLANREVDVITMAPMDYTTCTEALLAHADANIPVVNVDTVAERTDLVVPAITSDNCTTGVKCVRNMMEELEEGFKIYIMNQPSGTACVQREQGFRDAIGDYFNIIRTLDTSRNTAMTLPVAEDAITADSGLAGFFCINDMAVLGCVQVCAIPSGPGIAIYGVDGSPDFMSYVANGSATGSVIQQPPVVGANAVDVALSYLVGKTVEGEITVPVELTTADSVGDFDISDWQ